MLPVRERAATLGVPAVLLGATACVSCTLSLVAALGAAVGVTAAAPLLGVPPLLWIPIALGVTGALFVVLRRLRRAEVACAVPPARSPYLSFSLKNAALGTGLALASVAGVAFLAKFAVEAAFGITYTIHWTSTVPALVASFAWVFHGELNRRARQ